MTHSSNFKTIRLIDAYFQFLEKNIFIKKPINLKKEKSNFFNSNCTYCPVFHYPSSENIQLDRKIEEHIHTITDTNTKNLYLRKYQEYSQKSFLVSTVGKDPEEFTTHSKELFGDPDSYTITVANKIIEHMPNKSFARKNINHLRFKKIQKKITRYLKNNNLQGKIHILKDKQTSNNVSIGKITGNLNISYNYIADDDEVRDIIYHEIETHMRRLENGHKQKFGIFVSGTEGYLKTEEGLATITGHIFKKNKNLWHPSLLAIAIHTALQTNFAEVYNLINSFIKNPFLSWSYAVRAKCGISNTKKNGALTKDLYLKWSIRTAQELIDDPQLLKTAYNGKSDLNTLKRYTQDTQYLPKISIDDVKSLMKENFISI